MAPLDGLLAEYAADHQNPVNRRLHTICVPVIVISLVGLLWSMPVPAALSLPPAVNWATVTVVALAVWYLRRSVALGLGMCAALAAALAVVAALDRLATPLWLASLAIFAVGWVGQFIGHGYEGKRPSFFRDLRFLLIGPLWVLDKLYRTLGIRVRY